MSSDYDVGETCLETLLAEGPHVNSCSSSQDGKTHLPALSPLPFLTYPHPPPSSVIAGRLVYVLEVRLRTELAIIDPLESSLPLHKHPPRTIF